MFSLASPDTLRGRLSLPEDDGVLAVITSAIEGATSFVEAKLHTIVEAGENVDWFRVDEVTLTRDGTYRLLLTRGFVTDVVVGYATEAGGTTTAGTALKVDADKGLVVVPVATSFPLYIKCSYSFGFDSTDAVPNWLQEVAMAYAVQLMSIQQVNDQKDELSKTYQFLKSHGTEILDAHLRRDAFAIRPFL